MSDTATIPFQTASGASASTPTPESGPQEGRRNVLVIAGVAAVALLALGGYFLFFAGGGDPAPATPAPAPSGAAVQPSAPAAEPAAPAVGQKINARNFGTDPFTPLVQEAAPAAAGTTTVAGTASAEDTGATSPGDPAAAGSTASTPTQTTSHSFRVVSVAPNNGAVDVNVDGKVYRNLHAGEVFATYFKVVLISGTTNAFQYGEEKFNVLGTKRLTIA